MLQCHVYCFSVYSIYFKSIVNTKGKKWNVNIVLLGTVERGFKYSDSWGFCALNIFCAKTIQFRTWESNGTGVAPEHHGMWPPSKRKKYIFIMPDGYSSHYFKLTGKPWSENNFNVNNFIIAGFLHRNRNEVATPRETITGLWASQMRTTFKF